MSRISTQQGDNGQTRLIGGSIVSKSHRRIEACGTIDELNCQMGFARSICQVTEINDLVKTIQRQLFIIGSSLATPPDSPQQPPQVTISMVEALTEQVHRIEQMEGILFNWILPGEDSVAAAFDVARTVCRRAERQVVQVLEMDGEINPNMLPYLNRLSDLLWLLGRWLEANKGIEAGLDRF